MSTGDDDETRKTCVALDAGEWQEQEQGVRKEEVVSICASGWAEVGWLDCTLCWAVQREEWQTAISKVDVRELVKPARGLETGDTERIARAAGKRESGCSF